MTEETCCMSVRVNEMGAHEILSTKTPHQLMNKKHTATCWGPANMKYSLDVIFTSNSCTNVVVLYIV